MNKTTVIAYLKFLYDAFKRFISFIQVRQNQRENVRVCQTHDVVALECIPIRGGRIGRYYHFLFDLLLPLSLLIQQVPDRVVFYVSDFGTLSTAFLRLFGDRVCVQPMGGSSKGEPMPMLGMDPRQLKIKPSELATFRQMVFGNIGIDRSMQRNKVLLIQRSNFESGMWGDDKKSGSALRSIKNHDELAQLLTQQVHESYEFHNLILEDMLFEQQVQYFNSAALVIAQHGAGLSNAVWMEKGSTIFEFGFKSKLHFKRLSAFMDLTYFSKDYSDAHINVNCTAFLTELRANEATRKFFTE